MLEIMANKMIYCFSQSEFVVVVKYIIITYIAERCCWNCRMPGHSNAAGTYPRKRFWFCCGKLNVIVITCPICSKLYKNSQCRAKKVVSLSLILIWPSLFPRALLELVFASPLGNKRLHLEVKVLDHKLLGHLYSGASHYRWTPRKEVAAIV